MATGNTGFMFKKDGVDVDFYDVFQPLKAGDAGQITMFSSSKSGPTTDLGELFSMGNSGITTGYKNNGKDLGSLFAKKLPFTASVSSGLLITGSTTNYYYAIFVNPLTSTPAPGLACSGKVYPTSSYTGELIFVGVGGGGGGGGSRGGHSNGGGGGGGTHKKSTIDVISNYTITVGAGGFGGPPGDPGDGGVGGTTEVKIDSTGGILLQCTGGGRGNGTGAGAGGLVYTNNGYVSSVNGGAGGDPGNSGNGNGVPCTYNSVPTPDVPTYPLGIPDELIQAQPAYISNYYAGGGGGGKQGDSDADRSNFSGGQGGGTLSSNPNTGAGGTGGVEGQSATDGYPGNGYGSGGGGGGNTSGQTRKPGGAGAQGIVICYALLP